jgi:hypothetical protein
VQTGFTDTELDNAAQYEAGCTASATPAHTDLPAGQDRSA